jgi:DNA polymerase-3 subunit delta'
MTSLFGQEEQTRTLLEAARGGRMHHGWLLAGPRGVGKAGFARAAALRLLAEAAGPVPDAPGLSVPADHRIAHLVASCAHPDYVELERLEKDNGELARNISVDQIRGLQRLFSTTPSLSGRRIVVIDSADDLERGAANALLKNLEEPPPGTLFLLVTHAPSRLLPTIRSRCRILRFPALGEDRMRAILKAQLDDDVDEQEIASLLKAGEGSPGRALAFAGLRLADMERSLDAILATGDPDNAQRLLLGKSLSGKAVRPRYEAFLERAPAFIAAIARTRRGRALSEAIAAWEQAKQVASGAIILSLDPASVVFDIASLIAGLAQTRAEA